MGITEDLLDAARSSVGYRSRCGGPGSPAFNVFVECLDATAFLDGLEDPVVVGFPVGCVGPAARGFSDGRDARDGTTHPFQMACPATMTR